MIVEGPIVTITGWLLHFSGIFWQVATFVHYCGGGFSRGYDILCPSVAPVAYNLLTATVPALVSPPSVCPALENLFREHGIKTLLLGKVTHAIGGAILLAAGAAHVPIPSIPMGQSGRHHPQNHYPSPRWFLFRSSI
jgi:hypothetical protein